MTKNTWFIFIAIVIALFGGLLYLSSKNELDLSNVNIEAVQQPSEQSGDIGDHVFGSNAKKVVLIEYGDYQCPGCASAAAPIKQVTEKYQDKLTFVFRNFPLTSMHPNAKAAAAAAEAAGKLGKYWQMHNLLYEHQDEWQSASTTERNDLFASYAEQAGLSKDKFSKTLKNSIEDINKKIAFDVAIGKKSGVDGTPMLYLNGKKIDQKVADGKLIDSASKEGVSVWTDADAFDTLIIQPALKKAGLLDEE